MERFGQFLKNWAAEVVGKEVIITDDFLSVADKPQVTIFLREFNPTAPTHRHTMGPLEIGMRYLISATGAKSVTDGNELLQELAFSAMEHEGIDVDLSPPPPEFWLSLGIKSRPCFNVSTKEIKERKVVPVPLVTEPTEVNTATATALHGIIKSPSDAPISGAYVEMPSDGISVKTDASGIFRFGALMPEPDKKKIVIYYKQYSIKKTVSISKSPVEILFKP